MKISVVTVSLNSAATLEQTILSVYAQRYDNIEHIVVDGESTDGSREIIDRHRDKLSKVLIESDSGIYDAMNKGISLSTGDIVGFLNADDIYANENILSEISSIFEDDMIDGCYANLVYVSANDPEKIVRFWTSTTYKDGLFERGWMPAHPTFYVRKQVYTSYGGFNLDYKLQADYEITARLIAVKKINTRYIPKVWVRMRLGGATNRSIKNIVKGNLESYKACKKLGLEMSPLYFVTKFMMRIPQFFRRSKSGY